ncbi:MAG: NAD(P)/FAD-dependent oxidoreductase [Cellulosilyticaceae bacterium]
MFDIAIIGAGVIGCAIARELAKYQLDICVIEKNNDIANGTSKANSGIIHAGEDPMPGTMKAKMNIRGNAMFESLQEELDFPFKRNGSMVLCFKDGEESKLEDLRQRGLNNGMPDNMTIINREKALAIEPNLSDDVVAALVLPTGGIICPYEFTIALAENAYENGVKFFLDTKVTGVSKVENQFEIETTKQKIESKILVNAAGVHADDINNQLSQIKYQIIARKGEYLLFDKSIGSITSHTLFQLPTQMGKGILVTPTVSGNLLIGPTAQDIEDKLDVTTTREKLNESVEKAKKSIQKVPMNQLISSFAGLRAHEKNGDFIIGESEDVKNLINALGIESPGLTSAPAIAEYIREIIIDKVKTPMKQDFKAKRKGIDQFAVATDEKKRELIKGDRRYGKIVCRCEQVTEAEIIQAIKAPLGAKSLDGVKRRTRAGMGRCQAGFCMNRTIEILAEELGIKLEEVTKFGGNSQILIGDIKADLYKEGR